MRGHSALFPDFDELNAAEEALTARLDSARRKYAERGATAEEPSSDWLRELHANRFDQPDDLESLMDWVIEALDKHGFTMLMTELGVLAAVTVAAMATDSYWIRRSQQASASPANRDESPPKEDS